MPPNPAAFSLLEINLSLQPKQHSKHKTNTNIETGKFGCSNFLPGAGWSILAKQMLLLEFVPVFLCSPYFIKQGPGEFVSPPIGAALRGQAGCQREMWSQNGLTPPQPLLLLSARCVTASRSLVTSRDYLSSGEMHWQAAGGEPKATAKHEAGMAPASQHHVLLVLGILPLLPLWAWACVRQGSACTMPRGSACTQCHTHTHTCALPPSGHHG